MAHEALERLDGRRPDLAEAPPLPGRADGSAGCGAESRAIGGRTGDLGGDGFGGLGGRHEREREVGARLEGDARVRQFLGDEARGEGVDELERGRGEAPLAPAGYEVLDSRTYGAAEVIFLTLSEVSA
jgi:hypothetical protein